MRRATFDHASSMTLQTSVRITAACVVAATVMACRAGARPAPGSENEAIELFQQHVKEYVALHEKLEASIPKLDKGSPQQVETTQQGLAELVKGARRDAKQGDFFTPPIQELAKKVMVDVLSGPDAANIKGSIMDENPGVPAIQLNERWPSSVPLSTMPPEVLVRLPKLEGEMEYRFIGRRLILLDTEADIILDFTNDIFPK
jgi:hypothetical protein